MIRCLNSKLLENILVAKRFRDGYGKPLVSPLHRPQPIPESMKQRQEGRLIGGMDSPVFSAPFAIHTRNQRPALS